MLKGAAIYPPGPKRRLPGAMLLAFRRDPLGTTVNIAREYGDLAHYRIGGFHVYQASNPALIRDVLVVNNSKFIKSRGLHLALLLAHQLPTLPGVGENTLVVQPTVLISPLQELVSVALPVLVPIALRTRLSMP